MAKTLDGQVVDPEGQGIAGALVVAQFWEMGGTSRLVGGDAALTSADGSFQFPVPEDAATQSLRVLAPGFIDAADEGVFFRNTYWLRVKTPDDPTRVAVHPSDPSRIVLEPATAAQVAMNAAWGEGYNPLWSLAVGYYRHLIGLMEHRTDDYALSPEQWRLVWEFAGRYFESEDTRLGNILIAFDEPELAYGKAIAETLPALEGYRLGNPFVDFDEPAPGQERVAVEAVPPSDAPDALGNLFTQYPELRYAITPMLRLGLVKKSPEQDVAVMEDALKNDPGFREIRLHISLFQAYKMLAEQGHKDVLEKARRHRDWLVQAGFSADDLAKRWPGL